VDVGCADRRTACPRTAKSCGPGAPNAGVKFCRCSKGACEATVANAGSPGRPRISRKPLRREGRCDPACTCGLRALAQSSRAGPPGCSGHPAFPAPSDQGRDNDDAKLGRNTPRERKDVCAVSFHMDDRARHWRGEQLRERLFVYALTPSVSVGATSAKTWLASGNRRERTSSA
jgi:hypothetical protein